MKKGAWALAVLADIAVACEVVDGELVTIPVEVSSSATTSERLEEIGSAPAFAGVTGQRSRWVPAFAG